jgi:hypothetical protein
MKLQEILPPHVSALVAEFDVFSTEFQLTPEEKSNRERLALLHHDLEKVGFTIHQLMREQMFGDSYSICNQHNPQSPDYLQEKKATLEQEIAESKPPDVLKRVRRGLKAVRESMMVA